MGQHVVPGGAGRSSRRTSARERLVKHLQGHKEHHKEKTEEEFASHDRCQKEELKHVESLLK